MLTVLSILLVFMFIRDEDIRIFLALVFSVLILNLLQYGSSDYYLRCMIYDSLIATSSLFLTKQYKSYLITLVCVVSIILAFYEYLSVYQTNISRYWMLIQDVLFQAIITIACWNCKWRLNDNPLHRNNY